MTSHDGVKRGQSQQDQQTKAQTSTTRRELLRTAGAITTATTTALAGCGSDQRPSINSGSGTNALGQTTSRVERSDAEYVVRTADQLLSAVADDGATVWIPTDAVIDLTGYDYLTIADRVTMASDRGVQGSAGGMIRVRDYPDALFYRKSKAEYHGSPDPWVNADIRGLPADRHSPRSPIRTIDLPRISAIESV